MASLKSSRLWRCSFGLTKRLVSIHSIQILAKKNVKNSVQKQRSKRLVCIFAANYSCWHCPERMPQASTASGSAHIHAEQRAPPTKAGTHTAEGWERSPLHRKGVYSTLCSWRVESSKFFNQSHELSNGRCPGYDFFYPAKTLLARSVSSRVRMMVSTCLFAGKIFHIGVGSDVVCSTLIGNARASLMERTTDVSTLFFMPLHQPCSQFTLQGILFRFLNSVLYVKSRRCAITCETLVILIILN